MQAWIWTICFGDCSSLEPPGILDRNSKQPRLENQEFQWLEFFAGTAACTHAMRDAGFRGARFDKMYCKDHKKNGRKTNWMDILTPSGFVLLGCIFFRNSELGIKSTELSQS